MVLSNLDSPPASRQHEQPVDVRIRISALWVAMLFIFAYVDLFSLYRPDFRADLAEGKVFVFDVNQTFLLFVTAYIIIPSVLVYLSLVLRRPVNRAVNLVAAAIYGITIVGSAVGEWNYFILGSAVEAVLLAVLARHAWLWSEQD